MPVRPDMLNGPRDLPRRIHLHARDSAFAYACNSYNLTRRVGAARSSSRRPARLGDVLTARAHERELAGRTGVYDVEVANQRGENVAFFRGKTPGSRVI